MALITFEVTCCACSVSTCVTDDSPACAQAMWSVAQLEGLSPQASPRWVRATPGVGVGAVRVVWHNPAVCFHGGRLEHPKLILGSSQEQRVSPVTFLLLCVSAKLREYGILRCGIMKHRTRGCSCYQGCNNIRSFMPCFSH